MLLGAHWAGAAIEHSMLGATHACANPLTRAIRHGARRRHRAAPAARRAVERAVAGERYAELPRRPAASLPATAEALASRLEELAVAGGLPQGLAAAGVEEADLPALAVQAAQQWTGRYNPRPFDERGARELYRAAFA